MKQHTARISFTSLLALLLVAICSVFLTHCKKLDVERQVLLKTNEVTGVSYNEASVSGTLIDLGGNELEQHGFQWSKAGQSVIPGNTISMGKTSQTGQVTGTLHDLEPGTTYHVWTYVNDGTREYTSDPLEFFTLEAGVPVVVTGDTLEVSEHHAEIACSLESNGGLAVSERGICWGLSPNPTIDDQYNSSGSDADYYVGLVDGLQSGTTYFARAYATNELDTGYGDNREFTTKHVKEAPTVETRIGTIGETTIEFGGFISNTGGSEIIEKGVVIGETGNEFPTVENGVRKRITSGTDLYSLEIDGFMHYTVYYIRAYALNDAELVGYGDPIRVRTLCSCGELLVDPRDLQEYATVQIGGQCWMAENLNAGTFMTIDGGQGDNGEIEKFCYDDNPSNCNDYGGLYTWDEMMQYSMEPTQGVCPEGWHIASDEEWMVMEEFLGVPAEELDYLNQRGDDEGGMLKLAESPPWNAPNALATNSTNFSALPAGMIFTEEETSDGMGDLTVFWTSSVPGEGLAIYRMLVTGHGGIERWEGDRLNTTSVRCVRD
jgi:uncharacterized protein (TIGR02145 family)